MGKIGKQLWTNGFDSNYSVLEVGEKKNKTQRKNGIGKLQGFENI